jgi:tetratricopeptide (TPR) repeat protein
LSIAIAWITATLSMIRSEQGLKAIALAKLARNIDDPEAYRFQRPNEDWLGDARRELVPFQPTSFNDPLTVESLLRPLNDYGALGSHDWRNGADVRLLPEADRDDLELWLSEQMYRYCRALEDRPNSPADWRRALDILDRAAASRSLDAFTALGHRLLARLDSLAPRMSDVQELASPRPATPIWLDAYLRGVAAECDAGIPAAFQSTRASALPTPRRAGDTAEADPLARMQRRAALRALDQYHELLVHRPNSYWGHYRIAAVLYSLGRFAETAQHLEECLARRPHNAALRGQRAACLAWLERFPEALEECNRALDGAPDRAELFRTRAFIRAASGQSGGLSDDIQHFEVLSRRLPRAFWELGGPTSGRAIGPLSSPLTRLSYLTDPPHGSGDPVHDFQLPDDDLEIEPGELSQRAVLVQTILRAGEPELALIELGKILMLDQDQFPVRMTRALVSIRTRRFDDAARDLEVMLDHPGLGAYLRENPTFILRFHDVARALIEQGMPVQARAVARRTLDRAAGDADPPPRGLSRALLEIDARQFERADQHVNSLLGEPGLSDFMRTNPAIFAQLHELTRSLLRQGRSAQAQTVARRILELAIKLSQRRAPAHYNLARAYAACGQRDPSSVVEAADQLFHASHSQPEYLQNYERDAIFDSVRAQLGPMLAQMPEIHRMPDPTAEYRRRFSSPVAKSP